jgi:hypothetical protein
MYQEIASPSKRKSGGSQRYDERGNFLILHLQSEESEIWESDSLKF